MSYSYVTRPPISSTPPAKGAELDGVDIITLFENAANTFFYSKFTVFTDYAQDLLSIALVFYFLFQIITSAMVNDTKAVKMMGATFLWVCVVTVLTKEATYNYWVIDTMNSLRNGLVSYFVGSQNDTVWDLVKTGLILGQDTAMSGNGGRNSTSNGFSLRFGNVVNVLHSLFCIRSCLYRCACSFVGFAVSWGGYFAISLNREVSRHGFQLAASYVQVHAYLRHIYTPCCNVRFYFKCDG